MAMPTLVETFTPNYAVLIFSNDINYYQLQTNVIFYGKFWRQSIQRDRRVWRSMTHQRRLSASTTDHYENDMAAKHCQHTLPYSTIIIHKSNFNEDTIFWNVRVSFVRFRGRGRNERNPHSSH